MPPPLFAGRLDLPAPAHDVEALAFGVQRLVRDLADWLNARGLGAVRLTLVLDHERYLRQRGVPATEVPFALGAPARTPSHLMGVLRERLARVTLPAPVEAMTLRSDETAPLAGRNLGLLPGDDADRVEVPLVDRLRARLGEDALDPPRAACRASARAARCRDRSRGPRGRQAGCQWRGARFGADLLPDAPRPLWLLAEPQPLALDHGIAAVGAARRPRAHRVGMVGRRRRAPRLLRRGTHDGATVWIYRDHRYGVDDGEWFLHGLFA